MRNTPASDLREEKLLGHLGNLCGEFGRHSLSGGVLVLGNPRVVVLTDGRTVTPAQLYFRPLVSWRCVRLCSMAMKKVGPDARYGKKQR
mmetsp:Transcript_29019/g.67324  ORF Transcript_29019/g.67324 Transcript_29019/m.67324 type:complete len:89 (-) Transcript_29019:6-272(-)